jgi:hypothetical protein
VARQPWIAHVHRVEGVFVGPGRIIVTAWVTPLAELLRAPAEDLLERVEALRTELLAEPVVAEITITVTAAGSDPTTPATAR